MPGMLGLFEKQNKAKQHKTKLKEPRNFPQRNRFKLKYIFFFLVSAHGYEHSFNLKLRWKMLMSSDVLIWFWSWSFTYPNWNEMFWMQAVGAEYFKSLSLSTWEKSFFVTGISGVSHLWYVMSWECPLSFCINGACQAQSTNTLQSDLWPGTSILQMTPLLIPEFACIHSKQGFLNL